MYVWRDGLARLRNDEGFSDPTPPSFTDAVDLRHYPPPEPLLRLVEQLAVRTREFVVALPRFPGFLPVLLAEWGWRGTVAHEGPDGVFIRLSPEPALDGRGA